MLAVGGGAVDHDPVASVKVVAASAEVRGAETVIVVGSRSAADEGVVVAESVAVS